MYLSTKDLYIQAYILLQYLIKEWLQKVVVSKALAKLLEWRINILSPIQYVEDFENS